MSFSSRLRERNLLIYPLFSAVLMPDYHRRAPNDIASPPVTPRAPASCISRIEQTQRERVGDTENRNLINCNKNPKLIYS